MRIPAGFMRNQLPAIGWVILILVGSSIPGKEIPDLGFKPQDKVAHIIEFSILGFLLFRAFAQSSSTIFRKYALVWAGLLGIAWGIMDEVHQLFVPGRCASPYDVIADIVGILVGIAICLALGKRDEPSVESVEDECSERTATG